MHYGLDCILSLRDDVLCLPIKHFTLQCDRQNADPVFAERLDFNQILDDKRREERTSWFVLESAAGMNNEGYSRVFDHAVGSL